MNPRLLPVLCATLLAALVFTASPADARRYPSKGDRGTMVRLTHAMLARSGVMAVRGPKARFDRTTAAAVRRFQRAEHLRATGRITPRTWRRLVEVTGGRRPLGRAPRVIAHRGAVRAGLGEQTLGAMRYAVAGGATQLEFDVRWTVDDVPVAMHDATLDRTTTTCTGAVSAYTLEQLQGCRVRGEAVPTVAAIVELARSSGVAVYPEIKGPSLSEARATTLVATLGDVPADAHAFNPAVFAPLRTAGFTGDLAWHTPATTAPATVLAAGATMVAPRLDRTLTPARVRAFQRAGLPVWAWTARTFPALARARTLGVDAVSSDDAPVALRFLGRQR